jgi:hypothetical protein
MFSFGKRTVNEIDWKQDERMKLVAAAQEKLALISDLIGHIEPYATLRGRPRFRGPDGTGVSTHGNAEVDARSTCCATHSNTSVQRHNKRLLPGSRQIGGSTLGLREASLRMLAGVL